MTAGKRGAGGERLPLGRPGERPQGFGTPTGLPNCRSTCEKARRTRAGVRRSADRGACQGKRTSATASRAMRLTGAGNWGPPRDRDEALAVLRRAVDLGVNVIDTADVWGPGVSEELIAQALYPYPQDLVIATKGGLVGLGPGQRAPDGRPEHLRTALEASLQRLRLERIDLYQLHRPDPNVPFEESVGALAELQRAGKIRYIGVSNVTSGQLARARRIVPIAAVENRYNLTDRGSESEEVLEVCARDGMAFLPYVPLATGELTRGAGLLDQIARRHDATGAQIALAWLLQRSPVLLPIPGTSSVRHLDENVAAAGIRLSQDEFERLSDDGRP